LRPWGGGRGVGKKSWASPVIKLVGDQDVFKWKKKLSGKMVDRKTLIRTTRGEAMENSSRVDFSFHGLKILIYPKNPNLYSYLGIADFAIFCLIRNHRQAELGIRSITRTIFLEFFCKKNLASLKKRPGGYNVLVGC
jgi:hypothetical protein